MPVVSDHRPLSFGFRRPDGEGRLPPLRDSRVRHPEFARWVASEFHERTRRRAAAGDAAGALERLKLLKEAMLTVDAHMREEDRGAAAAPAGPPPPTAGSAFALLAGVRRGAIATAAGLKARLPEAWRGEVAAHGDSLAAMVRRLRDLAAALTRTEVRDAVPRARQNSIAMRLARLARRAERSGVHLLDDGDGGVVSDEREVAFRLSAHGATAFSHKGVDEARLKMWAQAASQAGATRVSARAAAWRRRARHISKARRSSGNTRPGPDGVPFAAWRAMAPLGVQVLWEAGTRLEEGLAAGKQGHDVFNESPLCCLPKQPVREAAGGAQVFEPRGTRPLSITSTDNRIIAGAYWARWEPLVAPHITEAQRGFVGGRSMLRNMIDIDHAAMCALARHQDAAIILFGFASAFLKVSRRYLTEMARAVGSPVAAMAVLGSMYHRAVGTMMHRSRLHGQVPLEAAIGQGCPLSPLLFSLASDSLLRIVGRRHPECVVRASADDTAMVVPSWGADQARIFRTFEAFAAVSSLKLNMHKTVVVPLWPCDPGEACAAEAPGSPGGMACQCRPVLGLLHRAWESGEVLGGAGAEVSGAAGRLAVVSPRTPSSLDREKLVRACSWRGWRSRPFGCCASSRLLAPPSPPTPGSGARRGTCTTATCWA